MTASNWNDGVIAEFRANEGRVGGQFAGANMVLLHHVGRRSGREYVAPVVWFHRDDDAGTMFVVGSAAGAPTNPQWFDNLVAAGRGRVEVGTETFDVDVEDLQGDRWRQVLDGIQAQAAGFADYERKIDGARKLPVLALRRR